MKNSDEEINVSYPKIGLSYNDAIGGAASNKVKKQLELLTSDVKTLDYYKIAKQAITLLNPAENIKIALYHSKENITQELLKEDNINNQIVDIIETNQNKTIALLNEFKIESTKFKEQLEHVKEAVDILYKESRSDIREINNVFNNTQKTLINSFKNNEINSKIITENINKSLKRNLLPTKYVDKHDLGLKSFDIANKLNTKLRNKTLEQSFIEETYQSLAKEYNSYATNHIFQNIQKKLEAINETYNIPINSEKIFHKIFEEAKLNAEQSLSGLDGLVIPGNDAAVDSRLFDENIFFGYTNLSRSVAELALIHVAVNKGIPILGICGGHQILNVYFGGKTDNKNETDLKHIIIDPDSELFKIIAKNPDRYIESLLYQKVSLMNNQVVTKINDNAMQVAARHKKTKDIMATESKYGAPIATYQFHPELQEQDIDIIQRFVKSCVTYKQKREMHKELLSNKSIIESKLKYSDDLKNLLDKDLDEEGKNFSKYYKNTFAANPSEESLNPKYFSESLRKPISKSSKDHNKFSDTQKLQENLKKGISNFREILKETSTQAANISGHASNRKQNNKNQSRKTF